MPRRLYLGTELAEMPEQFLNLYKSVGRQAEYKFDVVNRILESEPYKACLKEAYITSCTRKDWWMEFETDEDYLAFLLRWS